MSDKGPNIIFILIDDMGWRDIGCYGSEFYETPNIDRLAGEGMMFSDAYAACPVCSPTRASILTGKYPGRLRLTNYLAGEERGRLLGVPYIKHLALEETTIARALKEQGGYRTYHVGKWHLGPREYWPENHGFDVNIAGCECGMPEQGYFSPWGFPTLEDGPEGEYLTDRLTDEVIRLLRDNGDDPFFLYFPTYLVHTYIQAKEDDIAHFEAKAERMGLDKVVALVEGENFPCEHKRDQHIVRRVVQSDATYAAMIKCLDDNIGRLMAALEELGKADDTLIVFTSDNGGLATAEGSPTCNAPLAEGKGWMYEGGTREPLLVRWPGKIEAGSTCDTPVTSPDFFPTLLEAAGLDPMPEQHCDGESILPLLTGQGGQELADRAIYWHYPHYGNQGGTPGSSVREGDWKLIEFFEDGRLELYNLRDDIAEDNDVAGQFPDITQRLGDKLAAWRESVEAQIPQPNPDWKDRPGVND
ncbi:MAG: sulfatase [Planctomycetota bacterium]|jgi:arylsulfatase A-like enzyme